MSRAMILVIFEVVGGVLPSRINFALTILTIFLKSWCALIKDDLSFIIFFPPILSFLRLFRRLHPLVLERI